ncbi:hypothetical protein A4G20_09010 [Pasteurellaceae bacterium RH1A]|nr:hypothetical protein A4G20_09010 [Pasteurellaceae bacterium RH1A]
MMALSYALIDGASALAGTVVYLEIWGQESSTSLEAGAILRSSSMAPASSLVPWLIWKSDGSKAAPAWRLALSYALIDGASVLAGAVV